MIMRLHRFSIAWLILLLAVENNAQIAIGEWRTHLSYNFSTKVMVAGENVFCSTTGGLFYFNTTDNTVNKLSKTDGLSDNGVVAMKWSDEMQLAVLAYENSNIDIIRGREIINMPDIMKKQLPGDKTIYHIYFDGQNAYLSCGFGIVVIDLARFEITETYFIGDNGDQLKVNMVVTDDTHIYAATDFGIRKADLSNAFLMDFNSWQLETGIPGFSGAFGGIVFFNGRLFAIWKDPAGSRDLLYYFDGSWKSYPAFPLESCDEVRVAGNSLLFTGPSGIEMMNTSFEFVDSYSEGSPRSAWLDENEILWIADYGRGLVRYDGAENQQIKPDGPFTSIAYDMADADGVLYAVSGGVTTTYNNIFRAGSLHRFKDDDWSSNINYEYRDLLTIAVDPEDPTHLFAGSWGYGLVEFSDGKPVEVYDETNSSLQNAIPGSNVIRIGGIAFDNDQNLWMTNTGVANPISVRKADGEWKSFRFDGLLSSFPALGKIMVTSQGHIWGIINKGGGLFAMDPAGTIENEEDDTYTLVSVEDENGNVITNEVFSLAEDRNGNIWLGTDQGILVFYSPAGLFENGRIAAQEILVPRDDGTDYADPLLLTEKVTAIEVDGSNRKWLGTADGGAFLVSETGLQQVYNFNTNNSPLLSNSILDICVIGETGEVFFGTDNGIISFRGTATEGAADYDHVKVYPNPVRENYSGPIAIQGLLAETIVKITDISGNLVREISSFGGQAIWDGNDMNGNRVATGVYLVFLANRQPTAAHVAKILFIH